MRKAKAEEVIMVWTNAASPEVAEEIAQTLVKEKLAACVHVLPAGTSHYKWEGELQKETEHTLVIKTRRGRYKKLEARLYDLHPYDVPEIMATETLKVHSAYQQWVVDTTD